MTPEDIEDLLKLVGFETPGRLSDYASPAEIAALRDELAAAETVLRRLPQHHRVAYAIRQITLLREAVAADMIDDLGDTPSLMCGVRLTVLSRIAQQYSDAKERVLQQALANLHRFDPAAVAAFHKARLSS